MIGRAKLHSEVDPSSLRRKSHLTYLRRSNEAQGLGEQRFNHKQPVARVKAAFALHAEGGRLPSSAWRKGERGGCDVKGSPTPGLRSPLTSPPPEPARASSLFQNY